MRNYQNALLLAILMVSGCVPGRVGTQPAPTNRGDRFGSVVYHTRYDGDTCTLSLPGVHPLFGDHILVRLAGVNTPEIRGECEAEIQRAEQARDFVQGLLGRAKQIRLEQVQRDKFFRIRARVWADDEDVSVLLLEKGLARPYSGGPRGTWCPAR